MQANVSKERARAYMIIHVNVKRNRGIIIINRIKAERPVCEPTTVVLGVLDAVTSQIKTASHRSSRWDGRGKKRESGPALGMFSHAARTQPDFARVGWGQRRTGKPTHGGWVGPGAPETPAHRALT